MDFALRNVEALGLTGGALVIDDHIVAFTYGSPINRTTFGVHVEKAEVASEELAAAREAAEMLETTLSSRRDHARESELAVRERSLQAPPPGFK